MSLYTSPKVILSELAFTNTHQFDILPVLFRIFVLLAVQLCAERASVTVVPDVSSSFQYETRLSVSAIY